MRMLWLDLFRGLAALVVVLYHLSPQLHLPRLQLGYLAVDLFFILSGIVLYGRYDAHIRSGMPSMEFAWHRMRRLYPMVVITVAFLLVRNSVAAYFSLATQVSNFQVLGLLTLLPMSHGTAFAFPANINMWSLLAEFLSNAVWFVVLRFSGPLLAPVFIISAISAMYFAMGHGSFDYGGSSGWEVVVQALARALAGFGLGCWIARRRPLSNVTPVIPLVIFAVTCAACITTMSSRPLYELAVILSGAALLSALMHRSPKSARVGRFCSYLGMLSFPLYLIHPACAGPVNLAIAHGMNNVAAVTLIPLTVAIAATFLNEAIVRRLPSRLPRWLNPSTYRRRRSKSRAACS